MTRPVIQGYDGMTLQKAPREWSQQNAETAQEVWKGPQDKAVAMYNSLVGSLTIDSIRLDPAEGSYESLVTVSYKDSIGPSSGGSGLVPTEENNAIWEVSSMEVQKDIRTHPYFYAESAYLDNGVDKKSIYEEMAQIDLCISRGERYIAPAYAITNWKKKLSRYYGLRLKGVDTYPDHAMVIKKSVTVTKRSVVTVAWAGVGYVQALNAINPPNIVFSQLNDTYRLLRPPGSDKDLNAINDINQFYIAQGKNNADWQWSKWEWLKKAPTVTAIEEATRWQIQYQWWGAERWSSVFYNGSWDPSVDIETHETH